MLIDLSDTLARDTGAVPPAWVQDAVFYQIFPDRFARSDAVTKPGNLEAWDSPPTARGFKGGDLLGIVEHLDYLQWLGITALYLTPIFQSTANHRYHTHDYRQIDPILGGDEAFDRLLREAHGRGLRVVLDGVFNHASRGFFQFNHILENGPASPYIDWFTINSWPLHPYGPENEPAGYASWWDIRELPKFNTATPAVRDFLWNVGSYWMERGADGWRLDVPNEIDDDEFWREFRRRVRSANPAAYLVGEIWGDARRWLQGDQFDAVMNYLFTKACLGFFTQPSGIDEAVVRNSGLDPIAPLNGEQFAATIEWLCGLYPRMNSLAQMNLLGSHDTARFLTIARGDESAMRLALLFLMCYPGAPCMYYGDEIGMTGGRDPGNRGAFDWNRDRWNTGLQEHTRAAIALRREHAVLRHGDFSSLFASKDVYVFLRRSEDEVAIVALNTAGEERTVEVGLPAGMLLRKLRIAWGITSPVAGEGRLNSWSLPPRSGTVLLGSIAGDGG